MTSAGCPFFWFTLRRDTLGRVGTPRIKIRSDRTGFPLIGRAADRGAVHVPARAHASTYATGRSFATASAGLREAHRAGMSDKTGGPGRGAIEPAEYASRAPRASPASDIRPGKPQAATTRRARHNRTWEKAKRKLQKSEWNMPAPRCAVEWKPTRMPFAEN